MDVPNSEREKAASHEHHRRSAIRNLVMAPFQIAIGLRTGSYILKIAGGHNGIDGKVHELRHQAVAATSPERRKYLHRQAALILGATAVLGYAAERFIPGASDKLPKWLAAIFGVETAINGWSLYEDYASGSLDFATRASKLHNWTDTMTSAATTGALLIPNFTSAVDVSTVDRITGIGHTASMLGIAGWTFIKAGSSSEVMPHDHPHHDHDHGDDEDHTESH